MSQAPHEPTDEARKMAKTLSGLGVPQDDIATLIGVSKPTLHKHYREELDKGMAEANAKVAGSLFNQAVGGNTSAAIFWMKARANWSEKIITETSGPNGGPQRHVFEWTLVEPKNED
jgi:DNA-binding XRE family transcriptional regulator